MIRLVECFNENKTYTTLKSSGNGCKVLAGYSKQYHKWEVLPCVTEVILTEISDYLLLLAASKT